MDGAGEGRQKDCLLDSSLGPVQIVTNAGLLGFLDKVLSSYLSAFLLFLKAFRFDMFSDTREKLNIEYEGFPDPFDTDPHILKFNHICIIALTLSCALSVGI